MNKMTQRTKNNGNSSNRETFGKWLFIIVVAMFTLFIVRFAYIAITKDVQHVNLRSQAEQIYTQKRTILAKRGDIYDQHGSVLATDTSRYTLYAVLDKSQHSADGKPLYVKNKQRTAKILAKYIDIPKSQILKTLSKKGQSYQVEFGSAGANLSVAKMQQIKAEKLPGIGFIATPARSYPEGEFASQIIGMATPRVTNKETGQMTLVGQIGLEKYFNKKLTGKNGLRQDKRDVYGYSLANSNQVVKKAVNGDNVYTTLDAKVQHIMENKLTKVFKESKAESMIAVVMDAKTGKIIAASQRPTLRSKKDPVWRNMLVQDVYEPGSTMKTFALSAAIDSGHFDPNATFDSGTWQIGGGKVTDWQTSGWGIISYKDAFDLSSNVGFAHVEQNMGAKTWKKYLTRFGMFNKVNVEGMDGEVSGYSAFKGILQQANTAFGQGITVNAMQMMQGFSAIANNGKMMKPYIIDKVTNNEGKTIQRVKPKQVGQPIKASTSKKVVKMMEGVIYDKKGLGHDYQIDGYKIAGKTATAQIGGAGGYSNGDSNYLYSFVGIAPANNPRYVMYVTLRKPHNLSKPATKMIAEVFNPTMKFILSRQKSTKQKNSGIVKVPDVVNQSPQEASDELNKKHLVPVVIGSGHSVEKQSIAKGQSSLINQRIILDTGGEYKMPDINNWSSDDVQILSRMMGIKLKENGSGYVTKQSIKPNDSVKKSSTLTVEYSSRH
ncbi:penicillin-binding protein [Limosilactobacillus fastidiosus]|uniref:Penicillin-binding protein n=1 Tax=Limosilactobacillus fastidiosus TaxID=2759855 RepID=A0A7W3YB40_9LACO|nr:penicillin-binding transpeptidase domain-containing protein [Limosilactobacillus fastidiosus]MBB1062363.1 penicillin-binding protein [Limosilactobacillus fastidiosus]MBB1085274.1 penicillin-binding protein [Limosilactobacillus fastidiosus]MCD7083438.1 penicillin-binding protein [Limosilactobacillus fastidiosus]MCD7085258.1 penicillin-binding protein [Limosilactobacillus fastidiosus]MCD7115201.1 penicillin-binding protein [Limosilactobacillus fastidiosus]